MDSDYPYRPPESEVGGPTAAMSSGGSGHITPGIIDALKKTRPWVLFMSILILVGCGLMVLVALAMMAMGGFVPASEVSPLGGVALGAVYLVMAALYLYPGVRLLRYAGAIKLIDGTDSAATVEQALIHQLAFWRFVGLVSVVILGLYALIFVGAIIFGIIAATSG